MLCPPAQSGVVPSAADVAESCHLSCSRRIRAHANPCDLKCASGQAKL